MFRLFVLGLVVVPCVLSSMTKDQLRSFLDKHKRNSNGKRTEDASAGVEWICTTGMKIRGFNIRGQNENAQLPTIEACQARCEETNNCKSIEYGGARRGRRTRRCRLNRAVISEVEPMSVIDDENWEYCEMKTESPPYIKADGGSSCHESTMITDVEECRNAAEYFGKTFGGTVSREQGRPGGCFWNRGGMINFNTILVTPVSRRRSGGICRALTDEQKAGQCMYGISNALFEFENYAHFHNVTDVNNVCDITLGEHMEYFCGCMDQVEASLTTDMANDILASHPHGINVEMLEWEKECCCNAEKKCPTPEEDHSLECMFMISMVMEDMAKTIDLHAYGYNAECDIDDAGAKDYFCGCLAEMDHAGISSADIDEVLSSHTHGITYAMLGMEGGYCCMESGESSSEESSEESEEDFENHADECLHTISDAIFESGVYTHLHDHVTDENHVCDTLLMDHREYFCGCMHAVQEELSVDHANEILSAHPHGINVEGLFWEKDCCCNPDQMCPPEETRALECMVTIGEAMERMMEHEDLHAYGLNEECDIDDEGARHFVCDCLNALERDDVTEAEINEILMSHTHGITFAMLEMETDFCCMESGESHSEESGESEEGFENKAGECLYEISNAIYESPDYTHLHNATDVNDVCDILLHDHREYFCGCMHAVHNELTTDVANDILAAHPHGINIEGLFWEKECCCNLEQMCPTAETQALECMVIISSTMEHMSENEDLHAYGLNEECDIDDEGARQFVCGCLQDLENDGVTTEEIDEVLISHTHGITFAMLEMETDYCCMESLEERSSGESPEDRSLTHLGAHKSRLPEVKRKLMKKQKEQMIRRRKLN